MRRTRREGGRGKAATFGPPLGYSSRNASLAIVTHTLTHMNLDHHSPGPFSIRSTRSDQTLGV